MATNDTYAIECRYISKGRNGHSGTKRAIIRMSVQEVKGSRRKAVIYLGQPANKADFYDMSANIRELTPFNGLNAADAACKKAIKSIQQQHPDEVFAALSRSLPV